MIDLETISNRSRYASGSFLSEAVDAAAANDLSAKAINLGFAWASGTVADIFQYLARK